MVIAHFRYAKIVILTNRVPEGLSMSHLCLVTDIKDGQAKAFPHPSPSEDRDLIIVRRGLNVYGYVNRCPHAGTNLNWQEDEFMTDDEKYLMCFTHGALFEPDTGRCVAGPCAGAHLSEVNLEIENGKVFYAE